MSKVFLSSLVIVFCVSLSVQAAITTQDWYFDTDDNPVVADFYDNPNLDPGPPTVEVIGDFWDNTVHQDVHLSHQGVWCFEEDMIATIPNFPPPNPYKVILLDIMYSAEGDAAPKIYAMPELNTGEMVQMSPVGSVNLGDGFLIASYSAELVPNPLWETIVIRPNDCTLYVDELHILTDCIPEPATMCLLGLGGLALMRRRRA